VALKEQVMDSNGQGLRVRVHFGESDHTGGTFMRRPLWQVLIEYLRREGAAGATVNRGIAGFGANSIIHTASLVDLSSDLPLTLEWVDSQERVDQLLPGLSAILEGTGGLLTTDPVTIHRYQPGNARK
jgi:PII-like signaling protein